MEVIYIRIKELGKGSNFAIDLFAPLLTLISGGNKIYKRKMNVYDVIAMKFVIGCVFDVIDIDARRSRL